MRHQGLLQRHRRPARRRRPAFFQRETTRRVLALGHDQHLSRPKRLVLSQKRSSTGASARLGGTSSCAAALKRPSTASNTPPFPITSARRRSRSAPTTAPRSPHGRSANTSPPAGSRTGATATATPRAKPSSSRGSDGSKHRPIWHSEFETLDQARHATAGSATEHQPRSAPPGKYPNP
jgi:hypothetical protein